jgi:hypothetical protein
MDEALELSLVLIDLYDVSKSFYDLRNELFALFLYISLKHLIVKKKINI